MLGRYIDAHERADTATVLALMHDDARIAMPRQPFVYEGRAAIAHLLDEMAGERSIGEWRLMVTAANRQPATACYLRSSPAAAHEAFKLDVLRVRGGAIVEITMFDARAIAAFGLPTTLPRRVSTA